MEDETSPLLRPQLQDGRERPEAEVYNGSARTEPTTSDVDNDEQPKQQRKNSFLTVLIPLAVGIFLVAMDGTIVVSSYAAIGSELNELQNTSWIATAYLLTLTSFQPLYGKLSDIFGRKNCLLVAYAIFAVGCLLCGLARDMNELVISRAISGIGGGGMQTLGSIIVSDVVPLRSRGTWQGVMNIIFASGNAAGASLGGVLADTIGWRWAFLLQVPLALIAILSATFALHLPKTESSVFTAKLRRVDFAGAATLVLAVFFLIFGLDRGGNVSWTDRVTVIAVVASAVLGVLFMVVEMWVAKEPFAPRRIIFNRALIASYLVNFFGIAGAFGNLFYISLFLQAVFGKRAAETGVWLIAGVVGALCGSMGGGLYMQATGKYYMITVLASLLLLVGSVCVLLDSGVVIRSAVGILVGFVLSSLGNGAAITTSLISLIANAGQADQAIATAVSYLFRSLGSVVGLSVGSTLIQTSLRSTLREKLSGQDIDEIVRRVRESLTYIDELDPSTQVIVRASYETAIQVTFTFSVVMCFCGFLSSLFIKEKPLVRS